MKFFSFLAILFSLFISNAFANLNLYCKQQIRQINENGNERTIKMEQNWEFIITDNKIVVVGLESMFENMIRDKSSEKGTAFIAHNWIFDKDTPGKVIIGKSIKIDRTSGNGSILQIVMDTITTSPIDSCSTSKPKLLF